MLPDGTVLQQGDSSDRVEVSEDGTLCINFANERHTGTYKAIVENAAGKDEAETPIQVFSKTKCYYSCCVVLYLDT